MATSGVSTWSLTRDGLINAALRKLGVLSEGVAASATQLTTGAEALNSLLKHLMTKGMPLWAIKEYTFSTTLTNTYNIGNGQTLATPMPLKVLQAYRIESTGAANIPMEVKSHFDFELLPVNAATGKPISLMYQPLSTYGVIRMWPTPADTVTTVTITYQRPFEDFVTGTDDLDFPPYWTDTIIYTLAWRLAPEYGVGIQERSMIAKEAALFQDEALGFGSEESSIYLMPDWSGKK
jgi:hypothetical protein